METNYEVNLVPSEHTRVQRELASGHLAVEHLCLQLSVQRRPPRLGGSNGTRFCPHQLFLETLILDIEQQMLSSDPCSCIVCRLQAACSGPHQELTGHQQLDVVLVFHPS